MISVLILTLNEARNITDCVASLPDNWRDDVLILDSESEDETRTIASEMGTRVKVHPFSNYASQRNFGLEQSFKNEWILMIDADERVTPELAAEIETRLSKVDPDVDMFRCRRKDMFMGRWLRRSSGYPTYFPRLFRKGTVRVEREINEEYFCSGRVETLREHLIHFPFSKGLQWWYERHARYAAMEARTLSEEHSARPLTLSDLLSSDPGERRASLKQIAYRLPFRPSIVFFYLFLIRGGFLDGKPGYNYARMRQSYETMIDAMFAGLSRNERL